MDDQSVPGDILTPEERLCVEIIREAGYIDCSDGDDQFDALIKLIDRLAPPPTP